MTTQPLPTLPEMGPLSDREWRIYALAYTSGREDGQTDGYDHGFLAGVQCLLDIEQAERQPS